MTLKFMTRSRTIQVRLRAVIRMKKGSNVNFDGNMQGRLTREKGCDMLFENQ